eukprot:Nitzschia sp. Nitz4//scaffold87_size112219//69841//72612//NITZ4_004080-RA/size112219-processed-gene-0.136-mRNA-1//-1//CDS//3329559387//5058//frame0
MTPSLDTEFPGGSPFDLVAQASSIPRNNTRRKDGLSNSCHGTRLVITTKRPVALRGGRKPNVTGDAHGNSSTQGKATKPVRQSLDKGLENMNNDFFNSSPALLDASKDINVKRRAKRGNPKTLDQAFDKEHSEHTEATDALTVESSPKASQESKSAVVPAWKLREAAKRSMAPKIKMEIGGKSNHGPSFHNSQTLGNNSGHGVRASSSIGQARKTRSTAAEIVSKRRQQPITRVEMNAEGVSSIPTMFQYAVATSKTSQRHAKEVKEPNPDHTKETDIKERPSRSRASRGSTSGTNSSSAATDPKGTSESKRSSSRHATRPRSSSKGPLSSDRRKEHASSSTLETGTMELKEDQGGRKRSSSRHSVSSRRPRSSSRGPISSGRKENEAESGTDGERRRSSSRHTVSRRRTSSNGPLSRERNKDPLNSSAHTMASHRSARERSRRSEGTRSRRTKESKKETPSPASLVLELIPGDDDKTTPSNTVPLTSSPVAKVERSPIGQCKEKVSDCMETAKDLCRRRAAASRGTKGIQSVTDVNPPKQVEEPNVIAETPSVFADEPAYKNAGEAKQVLPTTHESATTEGKAAIAKTTSDSDVATATPRKATKSLESKLAMFESKEKSRERSVVSRGTVKRRSRTSTQSASTNPPSKTSEKVEDASRASSTTATEDIENKVEKVDTDPKGTPKSPRGGRRRSSTKSTDEGDKDPETPRGKPQQRKSWWNLESKSEDDEDIAAEKPKAALPSPKKTPGSVNRPSAWELLQKAKKERQPDAELGTSRHSTTHAVRPATRVFRKPTDTSDLPPAFRVIAQSSGTSRTGSGTTPAPYHAKPRNSPGRAIMVGGQRRLATKANLQEQEKLATASRNRRGSILGSLNALAGEPDDDDLFGKSATSFAAPKLENRAGKTRVVVDLGEVPSAFRHLVKT